MPRNVNEVIKLSSPGSREFWKVPVLYQDDDLLAVSKPAGLAVVVDPWAPEQPNLMKLLHEGIAAGKPWTKALDLSFLSPAYRLDAEASGILLLARNKPTQVKLADQFGAQKPLLSYTILVRGTPTDEHFEVNNKIGPSANAPGLMRVDGQRGKRARTRFKVVERFEGFALLHATPLTHRPHQIRLHVRRQRLAVVGDRPYRGGPLFLSNLKRDYRPKKDRAERPLVGRPAVHASTLELSHPSTGNPLSLECPLAKDMRVGLKYLRQYAPPTFPQAVDPTRLEP